MNKVLPTPLVKSLDTKQVFGYNCSILVQPTSLKTQEYTMFFFVAFRGLLCALAVQPFRRCRPHIVPFGYPSLPASAPPPSPLLPPLPLHNCKQCRQMSPSSCRPSATCPPGGPPKTLSMWLNVAHSDAPRRWPFFIPHPFQCGGMWGLPRQRQSPLPSVTVPTSVMYMKFSMSRNVKFLGSNRPSLL
jgi:hypothetical protein